MTRLDPDELVGALADVLSATESGPVEVADLTRLSGGASRETWAFTRVDESGAREELILQRARPGAVGTTSMVIEAEVVSAAAREGVPVAAVIASGDADDGLGAAFLVSRRVPGESIPRKLLRDEEFAEAREGLAAECGRALAAVHRIPAASIDGLDSTDQVAQFMGLVDLLGEPHPAFELGFRWLDANRPPVHDDAIVHGDFRLGNFLVDADGLQAVVDWELVHRGDPMEDLGWLCVKAWRFGSPLPAGGVGTYGELFDAYSEVSGVPVDPDIVHWWEVLGTLKWGVMCIVQAQSHLSGASRSVELAAIGRRICENEHDLLAMLP